ncbi:protein DMP6-like [Elaeis guineensis]|uniref:Protein DMP6-like n=1 Tax=Elaeis guineensis var. tenera TaxID=51953 RepID=A0A8N4F5J8_ELAGV|nr:protein DMP6-like [Elaeis guineensis]
MVQKTMQRTFKSTANLANLLPTGTVLTFQVLSPTCTNLGRCTGVNRTATACLVALCGLSCFILNFTDSFHDPEAAEGKVHYGLATFRGLWVFDDAVPREPDKFRIGFRDFVHAFMSVLVFMAVVLCEKSVVSCFYPFRSENMEQLLAMLPVAIGVLGSALFVVLPTTRHGIGFPQSPPP